MVLQVFQSNTISQDHWNNGDILNDFAAAKSREVAFWSEWFGKLRFLNEKLNKIIVILLYIQMWYRNVLPALFWFQFVLKMSPKVGSLGVRDCTA